MNERCSFNALPWSIFLDQGLYTDQETRLEFCSEGAYNNNNTSRTAITRFAIAVQTGTVLLSFSWR